MLLEAITQKRFGSLKVKMNTQDKPKEEPQFAGLHTMIPVEVKRDLDAFAQVRKTVTGSWDYGQSIRELLWAYHVFFNVNTRIDALEVIFKEHLLNDMAEKPKVQEKKKENPSGLLGQHGEVEKDGKDKG